tara:strand:+ start:306 stop:1019 length:714 start_codon:yes stop_codon:yes gene_type:complete
MKISMIIPVYNEERFITTLINKIFKVDFKREGIDLEVIVVNDGSNDNTYNKIKNFRNLIILNQDNQGKGRAVQNGINISTGDLIIIQDGDLEYDPKDIIKMYKKLPSKYWYKYSVYGSRYLPLFLNFIPKYIFKQNLFSYIANIIFILMFIILYGRLITDPLTGYKLYPRNFFLSNKILSDGFEADHEISAKLIRENFKILEVPISYLPRSKQEGKKINFFDGLKATFTILKYRFFD